MLQSVCASCGGPLGFPTRANTPPHPTPPHPTTPQPRLLALLPSCRRRICPSATRPRRRRPRRHHQRGCRRPAAGHQRRRGRHRRRAHGGACGGGGQPAEPRRGACCQGKQLPFSGSLRRNVARGSCALCSRGSCCALRLAAASPAQAPKVAWQARRGSLPCLFHLLLLAVAPCAAQPVPRLLPPLPSPRNHSPLRSLPACTPRLCCWPACCSPSSPGPLCPATIAG
jgi:hypothetical protein